MIDGVLHGEGRVDRRAAAACAAKLDEVQFVHLRPIVHQNVHGGLSVVDGRNPDPRGLEDE